MKLRAITLGMFAVIFVALTGCGTSAPRFRADAETDDTAVLADDDAMIPTPIEVEVVRDEERRIDAVSTAPRVARDSLPVIQDDTPAGIKRDKFLLDIIAFLKVPYSYGGSTKDGIDCSAFTSLIYASAGNILLPRSAREQYRVGSKVTKGKLRFGDLVFFTTAGRRPSHVGIYLENAMFAHASSSDGVTLSSLENAYYRKRFLGARRIVEQTKD
jgi:cell wall-associated NlpC family hydrolase